MLFAVIVGPVVVGSVYAGFKDTVDDDDATVTESRHTGRTRGRT